MPFGRVKYSSVNGKKPIVVFTAIVKDEEHVILKSLDDCRQGGLINAVAIVDNGSQDNTVSVIRDYIRQHNLAGDVLCDSWYHFDGTRNISFAYAEYVYCCMCSGVTDYQPKSRQSMYFNETSLRKLGVSGLRQTNWDALSEDLYPYRQNMKMYDERVGYIWNMDADDRLCKLPAQLQLQADYHWISMAEMDNSSFRYRRTNLFRIHPHLNFRWIYRIHETVSTPIHPQRRQGMAYLDDMLVVYSCRTGGRSLDPHKSLKDAIECELAATEDGRMEYLRYTFYAAQSYSDAGFNDRAISTYKLFLSQEDAVTHHQGNEYYVSCLRLSRMLKKKSDRLYYLYLAMDAVPTRLEAPYEIFNIHNKSCPRLAYEALRHYASIPPVDINSFLFVERNINVEWFYNSMAIAGYEFHLDQLQ